MAGEVRLKPGTNIGKKGEVKPTKAEQNWNRFLNSNYYAASGLSGAIDNLAGYNLTEEQRREQAEARLNPAYQTEQQALTQNFEQKMQGFRNQLSALDQRYGSQQESTKATFENNLSAMLNNLTKRGMGRSSLVGTGSVSMNNQLIAAIKQITDEYNVNANGVNENMSLATGQHADSARLLTDNFAQNVVNAINESERNDRESYNAQNQWISQMQYQAFLDWKKRKKGKKGGGGGGGGGGSSSGGGSSANPSGSNDGSDLKPPTPPSTGIPHDDSSQRENYSGNQK